MVPLDPRLNAFRPDLADLALKGKVEAARFIAGEDFRVVASIAPLRAAPSERAMLQTEALRGETVRVFETTPEGWSWAQLAADHYVGWVPRAALGPVGAQPTHRVSVLRTFAFAKPDIKSPPLAALPLGAAVTAIGEAEDRNARYALIDPAGAVVQQHLAPLDDVASDWTAVAERFVGTPYLWGGKTGLGIDCSGLVQVALGMCGIAAPRDTDMQETALGIGLPLGAGLPKLRRGDLVFWRGHVGLMRDADTLIHANAFHMAVASEPLASALKRMEGQGLAPTSIRRVEPRIATAPASGL
ncbi:MAG: NlpC/P60 family protein [Propylenella sp.]